MRCCWLFVLAPALVAAAQKPKDDAVKNELRKFQGSWRIVSVEASGKKLPEEDFKEVVLILEGDRHTTRNGADRYSGTFAIDPGKKPKRIDFLYDDGPEKGKTARGIYEFDGDTLKICLGLAGQERPTEFTSKPGSRHFLEVLKRQKKS